MRNSLVHRDVFTSAVNDALLWFNLHTFPFQEGIFDDTF